MTARWDSSQIPREKMWHTLSPGVSCSAWNTSTAFCQARTLAHCCIKDVKAAARGWKADSRITLCTSPVPAAALLTASFSWSMSCAGPPCATTQPNSPDASTQRPRMAVVQCIATLVTDTDASQCSQSMWNLLNFSRQRLHMVLLQGHMGTTAV